MLKKNNRVITAVVSSLLIIGSAFGFFVLVILVTQDRLSSLSSYIALILGFALIIVSASNNVFIVTNLSIRQPKSYLVNIAVCLLQSFNIFVDGFYFRYTQGFEWIAFIHVENLNNAIGWGILNFNLTHEMILNFKSSSGITFGINFFALAVGIYFYYLYKANLSFTATPRRLHSDSNV